MHLYGRTYLENTIKNHISTTKIKWENIQIKKIKFIKNSSHISEDEPLQNTIKNSLNESAFHTYSLAFLIGGSLEDILNL